MVSARSEVYWYLILSLCFMSFSERSRDFRWGKRILLITHWIFNPNNLFSSFPISVWPPSLSVLAGLSLPNLFVCSSLNSRSILDYSFNTKLLTWIFKIDFIHSFSLFHDGFCWIFMFAFSFNQLQSQYLFSNLKYTSYCPNSVSKSNFFYHIS